MNLTIKSKIFLIAAVVLFLAMGTNALMGGYFFSREYSNSIKSHSVVLARGLKNKIEKVLSLGISLDAVSGFEEQCQYVVSSNEGIAYAMVVSTSGKILFHNDPTAKNREIAEPEVLAAIRSRFPLLHHYSSGSEKYVESIEPVFDGYDRHVASVRVGFPHSYIAGKTRKLFTLAGVVGLGSLVLSAVLLYVGLTAWVTRPLGRLLASIKEIRQRGTDAATPLTVATKDEVGELSLAFSDMIRTLQATTVSKDYADNIIRNMMDALIVADPARRIVTVNRALCRLMGYGEEDLVGRSFGDLFGIGTSSTQDIEHLAFEGELKNAEAFVRSRDGRKIPVLLSSSAVRDGNGDMVCLVCTAQDITDRKAREDEALRTQKLESIGLLAGGIAHDFNNLLMAIMGNVTLARMHSEPGTKAFLRLAAAEKASLRAKDLTHQLLTFSRGGEPIKKAVSMQGLIRESAAFALRGSDVRCAFDLPEDLWPVAADEGQLSQVINNLIINADHAMPRGGTIRVTGENLNLERRDIPQLKDGRYVRVSIEDQGVGIPEEHLQKIFDPYFTTKAKGSGLGLATSYSIIRRHGGHIEVTSTPGVGTTFHIYLAAAEGPATAARLEETAMVPARGSGRILLMDDEELVRDVAAEMLRELGYDVTVADDGTEMVKNYREAFGGSRPYDAVILDLTVPGGVGGVDAITMLLAIDPTVRAVVSSGYSTDPIMAEYRRYGFSGVVAKPYQLQVLSETLERVLAKDAS